MLSSVYDSGDGMSGRFVARFTLTVAPDDVGRRVSLRRKLPDGSYADTLGELESWEAGTLRIRRRDGSLVTITEDTLVAGKIVPPPPPRRRPRHP
ncbi:MAG: hypothetical protein ACRDN9_11225 [Streptosporangiaceae bacterium]